MKKALLAPVALCLFFATALSLAQAQQMIPAPPDVAAPPPDAIVTASGLASKVLEKGTGTRHPKATDMVEVNYTGWTTDGQMFDSSIVRGQTATFPLNGVIAGWTEGVQLMVEGEKRRFWIPQNLAYRGVRGYPAGMLVFDVELIRIVSPAQ
jgi:FKBP-type peptidyl-prolyl cis-trans isomerase